jgi:hypothetical protein
VVIEIAIADALSNFTVNLETGCWNWNGALNEDGYGQISVTSGRCASGVTTIKAHRLFYVNHTGPLLPTEVIDHKCRNVQCVNPEHLEAVSNAENVRRGLSAKLTIEQVAEIRSRYRTGGISHLNLAHKYGVTERCIQQIVTGQSWVAGISNPILTSGKLGRPSRLSDAQKASLIGEFHSGISQAALARKYCVSAALVCLFIKEEKGRNGITNYAPASVGGAKSTETV